MAKKPNEPVSEPENIMTPPEPVPAAKPEPAPTPTPPQIPVVNVDFSGVEKTIKDGFDNLLKASKSKNEPIKVPDPITPPPTPAPEPKGYKVFDECDPTGWF